MASTAALARRRQLAIERLTTSISELEAFTGLTFEATKTKGIRDKEYLQVVQLEDFATILEGVSAYLSPESDVEVKPVVVPVVPVIEDEPEVAESEETVEPVVYTEADLAELDKTSLRKLASDFGYNAPRDANMATIIAKILEIQGSAETAA